MLLKNLGVCVCAAVDECTLNTDNCDNAEAICTDTVGTFTCTCNDGWTTGNNGVTCTSESSCFVIAALTSVFTRVCVHVCVGVCASRLTCTCDSVISSGPSVITCTGEGAYCIGTDSVCCVTVVGIQGALIDGCKGTFQLVYVSRTY